MQHRTRDLLMRQRNQVINVSLPNRRGGTPKVAPEPHPPSAEIALGERGEGDTARRFVRGSFFVCLPFLLIGKGAAVTTAGFALTLVFIGSAAGKLACGWIGNWLGNRATIAICQSLTAVGIVVVLLLPVQLTLVMLPFVGLVLNGVTTVIYGSVPSYAAPERGTHLLSVFYTITIGAAAVAPPAAGFLSDLIGIPGTITIVSALTLATIPCAFLLKDLRRTASV